MQTGKYHVAEPGGTTCANMKMTHGKIGKRHVDEPGKSMCPHSKKTRGNLHKMIGTAQVSHDKYLLSLFEFVLLRYKITLSWHYWEKGQSTLVEKSHRYRFFNRILRDQSFVTR